MASWMLYGLAPRPQLAELSCLPVSSELLASNFPFLSPTACAARRPLRSSIVPLTASAPAANGARRDGPGSLSLSASNCSAGSQCPAGNVVYHHQLLLSASRG